jgi:hypothetical protein
MNTKEEDTEIERMRRKRIFDRIVKEVSKKNPTEEKCKWIDFVIPLFNRSGSKYLREIPCLFDEKVDVYAVLDAFDVRCPARQHAIKKLLCAGLRGAKDVIDDLREARDAIDRAIQMQHARELDDDES